MRSTVAKVFTAFTMILCAWQAQGAEQERRTIILSDMSRCKPASALTRLNKRRHWRLIPYTSDKLNGTMLGAGPLNGAPEVTLPLDVKGWYSITVGYWNPTWAYKQGMSIRLKLSGDPCFTPMTDPGSGTGYTGTTLFETFWKHADLTGRDLVIAQSLMQRKAYLAYLKLVPLSGPQVEAIKKDRGRKDTRVGVAANDGSLHGKNATTREDIIEMVERYRHSDVGRLIWNVAYGDMTTYPSKVGYLFSDGEDAVGSEGQRQETESYRRLISKGIIPAEVAAEHAHRIGIKFDIYFRMAIQGSTPPFRAWPKSFVRRHPEFRIVEKDGTPVEKASYAFPETRELMLSLIREAAERLDVDGVSLCFTRGPEYVRFEKPVIDDFKKRYGDDPREVKEDDPRLLQLRAGYVTELVRGVRQLVDEIGTKRGKKIQLSAQVSYRREKNLYWNMDVETWLKEGLLDVVIHGSLGKFYELVKTHGCKTYYSIGTLDGSVPGRDRFVKEGLAGMRRGADGIFMWDVHYSQDNVMGWRIIRQLGHQEVMEAWEKKPLGDPTPGMLLLTVDGVDVTKTTSNENGKILWLFSGG